MAKHKTQMHQQGQLWQTGHITERDGGHRKLQKALFCGLLPGIWRPLMALRENNMLVMLEVGQVTGKPQFQAWGGSTRRETLYGQGFIMTQCQKNP